MQLLGVGRHASGWLNKSPDRAVQTKAEAKASLPFPVCTVAPCHCALSLRWGWRSQGGWRWWDLEVLESRSCSCSTYAWSQLLLANSHSAEAWQRARVKNIWVYGWGARAQLHCGVSPMTTVFFLFPALRNDRLQQKQRLHLSLLGISNYFDVISPWFSSKLSLWAYTGPDHCSEVMYLSRGTFPEYREWWWVWKGIQAHSVKTPVHGWRKERTSLLLSPTYCLFTSKQNVA